MNYMTTERLSKRLFVGVECEKLFRDDRVQLYPASTGKFRSASFSLLTFFHSEIIQNWMNPGLPVHLGKLRKIFLLMRQSGLLFKGGQNKLLVSNNLL